MTGVRCVRTVCGARRARDIETHKSDAEEQILIATGASTGTVVTVPHQSTDVLNSQFSFSEAGNDLKLTLSALSEFTCSLSVDFLEIRYCSI